MTNERFAVVGGGIIGAAVARRLLQVRPDAAVVLLEKEPALARHQTGHNSGVVHAGLYYTPGSLKVELCRRGLRLLREYCSDNELLYDECGKVLVARDATDERRLGDIMQRATANGVPGVRLLDGPGVRSLEPHVRGVAGLHSPETAIVDFPAVARSLAADAVAAGARVRTGFEVDDFSDRRGEVVVSAADGRSEAVDHVVVCAGLQTDRVSALSGGGDDPRIVPFRGEYYLLRPERRGLVRGLVYPVPDPRFPFLGVHITPRVDGEVMIGPNAVLALAREGYRWRDVSVRDIGETWGWPGFRSFARRHWRTGAQEVLGSVSRRTFVSAARQYVPDLTTDDVVSGPRGVRAQAMQHDGELVDDFSISRRGRVFSVRNAPSPAATSSLAIAEHLVDLLTDRKDTNS